MNELQQVFGTAVTVLTTGGAVANGDFSAAPTEFNNTTDSAAPYAPYAQAILSGQYTSAPTAGSTIDLYAVKKDVDGTNDDTDAPSGADARGAVFLGSFVLDDVTTAFRRTITISLEGIEKADFYLQNKGGQSLNTGAVLKIKPFTYKPKAT